MKLNERVWAGQIISWIKEQINEGSTIFQDAANDAGIKLESGVTKFPDILLFTDKVAGVIFNGWELKFPDTEADDIGLLKNALEKAQKIRSNSFVTWNGSQAIIWQIKDFDYRLESLHKLKVYPKEQDITSRDDLANPYNYQKHELILRTRLRDIIHDLEQLHTEGKIREAVNISSNIVEAIKEVSEQLIPLLTIEINNLKNNTPDFRNAYNNWAILEHSTINILSASLNRISPEEVLARFTYYKLISKVIFYLILSDNFSQRIPKLELVENKNLKKQLNLYFSQARKIDYQAVFESDFTDAIEFTKRIEKIILNLVNTIKEFDFKVLPVDVIGNILENVVPQEEKKRFGQYFTPENLATLVSFSAIRNRNDVIMDPTSGTGTFLNSFYRILKYFGNHTHQNLLKQIWGNDISNFPAILSVINLYKQDVKDIENFPRVLRKDFFSLKPGQTAKFPDPHNTSEFKNIAIPIFDALISNFPFIQQEDIPNDELSLLFKKEFKISQPAFLNNESFQINERSDYYIYCFYKSLIFLKPHGRLAAITSNAWLGKNYGIQFKKFLLDNFTIKYIVKSNAEHWFKDSKVSSIFITLEKGPSNKPVKFITIDRKLEEMFSKDLLSDYEKFYVDIDNCNTPENASWKESEKYNGVFEKKDNSIKVSIIEHDHLVKSLKTKENWTTYFIHQNPLNIFDEKLINPYGLIYDAGRGTRTGQDKMHIISSIYNQDICIDNDFLMPILKTSAELTSIEYNNNNSYNLFICDKSEKELEIKYPNTYKWIKKWENAKNEKGKYLKSVLAPGRKPYWYSLRPEEKANIFISINPSDKLFFSFSEKPIYLNQRLIAIRVQQNELRIIAAILNSIVSLLFVELNGVPRNLGALDLNADFFQSKMKMLNPQLLDSSQKDEIISKFNLICNRPIENYKKEFKRTDRINFDKSILKAFGYEPELINDLYSLLETLIEDRINLKYK